MSLEIHTVKCILVGDDAVGKTGLLTSYAHKQFPTGYVGTAFGGFAETFMVGNVPYALGVWDTVSGAATQERTRPLSSPQLDVFLACFSVGIVKEKSIFETTCQQRTQGQASMITTMQGEKLARELNAAKYVECSAKTLERVHAAFDAVGRFFARRVAALTTYYFLLQAVAAAVEYQQSPPPIVITKRKMKCAVL
ncbi:P-loop containing nucleoside triphosphate hydrolase protein [Mycena galopus ATCC 62051]|nr:P-loop containing nucleoside triphosphate hydrolase protein [Mycena galopus ATCC 62051]